MKKFEKNIIKQEYGCLELPVEKLSSINPANRSHGDGAEFIRSMRTITALRYRRTKKILSTEIVKW